MKIRSQRGITLIALVVTIILLIILAAIAINFVINGGLIGRAKEASFKMEVQGLKETTMLNRASVEVENFLGAQIEILEVEEVVNNKFKDMFVVHDNTFKILDTATDQEIKWCADIGIPLFAQIDEKVAFVFEIEVAKNETFEMDLLLNSWPTPTNDFSVYWNYEYGNPGNPETISSPSSNPSYTYSSGGTKKIAIIGTMSNGINFSNETRLTRVLTPFSEENLGITRTEWSSAFQGCTNLESIPEGLFPNIEDSIMNFTGVFQGCTKLANIPSGLFANMKVNGFMSAFEGCTSIETIPGNLFENVVMQFIPERIAISEWEHQDYDKLNVDFSNCFKGCTNLTTVGDGLFNSIQAGYRLNNSIQSGATYVFDGAFQNCTSLTTLPAEMFAGLVVDHNIITYPQLDYALVEARFVETFKGCTNLKELPADMFFGMFWSMQPERFLRAIKIDFSRAFMESGVEIVPEALFHGLIEIGMIEGNRPQHDYRTPYAVVLYNETFMECTNLGMIAPVILDNMSPSYIDYKGSPFEMHVDEINYIQSFYGTFLGCTNLQLRMKDNIGTAWEFAQQYGDEYRNYASSIQVRGKVLTASNMFRGCTNMVEIPRTIFEDITFVEVPSVFTNEAGHIETIYETGFVRTFAECNRINRLPALLFNRITFYETPVVNEWEPQIINGFYGTFSDALEMNIQIPGTMHYFQEQYEQTDEVILFGENNAKDFTLCFYRSYLQNVPSNLFDRSMEANTFIKTFAESQIRGDVMMDWDPNMYIPKLWIDRPEANGNGCFEGCNNIGNFEMIDESWRVYTGDLIY